MILTNPPFGGEEERGIQGNFPEDKQTAETALLFLQLIIRKLRRGLSPVASVYDRRNSGDERRSQTAATNFSKAAVVVPNGRLFGDGGCARIFWKWAHGNWHRYQPRREVPSLAEALAVVDKDGQGCFFGWYSPMRTQPLTGRA